MATSDSEERTITAASTSNNVIGKESHPLPELDDITLRGMRIEAGHAIPSEEPGLGITWDMPAIEQRRVHELTLLVD